MPGKVGFLNWGSGAGAIAGGIGGCGLAIPVAHALAASLGYPRVSVAVFFSPVINNSLVRFGLPC